MQHVFVADESTPTLGAANAAVLPHTNTHRAGNCQLVLAESLGNYHRLGATLDDAPGEAFDKV